MSIEKVSFAEISAVREKMPAKPKTETVNYKSSSNTQDIRYVDKFSDKKIADFFAPYGYVFHERNESDGSILVVCNDCQIIFNDFTLTADYCNFMDFESGGFKFFEFSTLCEQANTTPSQAIQDRLEYEIFNNMPYYVERKKKFNDNNFSRIVENEKYGQLMLANIQKQQHRENLASLNKTYGSSDPEKIADTLARLNPNK